MTGEVVSTRSFAGLLDSTSLGLLLKPARVNLVPVIDPRRILIGCHWEGMLRMLRMLRILLRCQLHPPGSEINSRRILIGSWKMLLLMCPLSPAGSYLPGYPGWMRCRGTILFFLFWSFWQLFNAVISGSSGSWVGDPVKAIFPGQLIKGLDQE